MRIPVILFAILFPLSSYSQESKLFVYGQISDKTVSLTPFYKVFGSNFDPAVTLGGGVEYLSRGNSAIFHQLEATWYSADMIGAGLTLSSSMGYRYAFPFGLFAEASLGVCGTGFISDRETFSLDDAGNYKLLSPLHGMLGVPLEISMGYHFNRYSVFCRYRYMIEGRYTDILPMLPTSLTGVGLRYSLQTNRK